MSTGTLSPEEIKQEEQNTGQHDDLGASDSQANDELGALQGSWDTKFDGKNSGNGKKKFWTKRKKAAGGITGLGIAGIFAVFSILQGPAQLIHASQLLSNFHFAPSQNASSSRIGRLYEYFRTNNDPSKRNVGWTAERLTKRFMGQLADSGIDLNFEGERVDSDGNRILTRRVQSLTVDPANTDAIKRLESLGLKQDEDGVFRFRNSNGTPGKNSLNSKQRRKALYAVVDTLDKGRFSSAITKRMLVARAGVDLHPFKNKLIDEGESLFDTYKQWRTERSEKHKNGVDPPDFELEGKEEDDPSSDDPEDKVNDPGGDELGENIDNAVAELGDEGGGPRSRLNISRSFASKVGGGVVAVAGLLCAVDAVGDSIGEFKQNNINLPMIRMATEIIAMGSQIQTGQDINLDEVGGVVDTLYSEEDGSFFGAAGMQAVAGNEEITGPDTNVKPSYNEHDKPELFNMVDGLPIDPVCAVSDGIGKFVDTITFGLVGDATDALTGAALGTFGTSQDELMTRLLSVLSGDLVDTFAQGSKLGNIAAIGGRLSANSAAIAAGGTEMSPAQFNTALNSFKEQEQARIARLPLKDRLFNLNSGNSLATITLAKMPYLGSYSGLTSAIRNFPDLFGSSFSSLFSLFTPNVSAATTYDFGVPAYGITQDMLDDEDLADPYAIEDQILSNTESYEKYEKCYSTKIDYGTGVISENEDWDPVVLNDPECTDNSDAARRFSMYMFDLVTFKGAACGYGIDEQACSEVGFGAIQSSDGTTQQAPSGSIIGDPYSPGANVQCAAGTTDLGVSSGYSGGEPFEIRLCSLDNLPSSGSSDNPGRSYSVPGANGHAIVNSRMSGAWYALIEAAKADGIDFGTVNSSFRSMAHQQSLCSRNALCRQGNSSQVATPGYSSHQAGVAIDFSNMGSTGSSSSCSQRATHESNPGWVWLRDNASDFGIKQYSGEAWHWDALPAVNRC